MDTWRSGSDERARAAQPTADTGQTASASEPGDLGADREVTLSDAVGIRIAAASATSLASERLAAAYALAEWGELMDAVVSIGLIVALVGLIRWMTMQICPWGIRLLERLVKRIGQVIWQGVWSMPTRNLGASMTIWLWTVVVAVGVTVVAGASGGEQLPAAATLWIVVILGWLVRRWWAERYFRPRDLPTRRRWRRLR